MSKVSIKTICKAVNEIKDIKKAAEILGYNERTIRNKLRTEAEKVYQPIGTDSYKEGLKDAYQSIKAYCYGNMLINTEIKEYNGPLALVVDYIEKMEKKHATRS